jgi:hypothetical protein
MGPRENGGNVSKKLLKTIDAAIAQLQQVRSLVLDDMASANRGTKTAAKSAKTTKKKPARKHHSMSEEGRERIRQAQRKRWAAIKRKAKKAAA